MEEARQDGRIIPRDLSLSELPLGLDSKTLSRALFARYSTSLFENLSNFLILFRNASPSTLVDHPVKGIKIGCMEVVWKNRAANFCQNVWRKFTQIWIDQNSICLKQNLLCRNFYF